MPDKAERGARTAVIAGPYTSGKTTLLEAMLNTAGAIQRKGSIVQKSTVGDASPEARARQMTTEANIVQFSYLGEAWTVIDCPGSVELQHEQRSCLTAADVAIVVAEPDPAKAPALMPLLRYLDELSVPHLIFVNKIDKAVARVADILAALQTASARPLVLREVPIRAGDSITGYVDLVSERAFAFNANGGSDLIEMPDSVKDRESAARQEMLEHLADFDDALMEQLLEDKVPATSEVYAQLARDLQSDLIVPVFIGSAERGNGIVRLLKALRHEAPTARQTAERLAIPIDGSLVASVLKTVYQAHTGKLSVLRVWKGEIKEGQSVGEDRPSGLYRFKGGEVEKVAKASAGDVVGLGRCEHLKTGDLVTDRGVKRDALAFWPASPQPVYAMAVRPVNRADEVKLTGSIAKLIEEDPSLSLEHNHDTRQLVLWGQGEIHLQLAVERLKSKYNVAVETERPQTPYKETIRHGTQQHSRFKRQSGGHGQFADIKVEIKSLPRGSGFVFEDKIVGGAIPRQFIPSVEEGLRDSLSEGPLGFPVVDVGVRLFDGQFHSVDSSDMAFKTAGRLAMTEGLPKCNPILLEPIAEVVIDVPTEAMSRIHGIISSRRGQILGFEQKPGWDGWDQIKCHLPMAELGDLIVELRSATQGAGSFTWRFDRLQELQGRPAEKIIAERQQAAAQ
ncbi:MAG TPA: elongation factor G [Kiloniellales bacterium]|nr:elongation factor G [Kiloniellales bacterium]